MPAGSPLTQPAQPAQPLTLHLVRHGRTRYNAERLLQGWSDSELTDDGLVAVRETAEHLRPLRFVAAYASPSGRTVATAQEILRHHPDVPLETDARLREFSFGEFEARPEEELATVVDPVEMFRGVFDGTFTGLPGGEAGRAYLARVAHGFGAIERAHAGGGSVLVVSHGVTLMAYLTMVAQPPVRLLPNASVSTIRIDPDGTRTLVSAGVDPSGAAAPDPVSPLRAARVALEEAASWQDFPDAVVTP